MRSMFVWSSLFALLAAAPASAAPAGKGKGKGKEEKAAPAREIKPAAKEGAPKAASFDELLVGARSPGDYRVTLEPLFAECAKEPDLAARQCSQIKGWHLERIKGSRYVATADAAAMQVAPYDATTKSVSFTVSGCLACQQPPTIAGAPRLLAIRAPKGFADGAPIGLELGEHEVAVDPAKAKKWQEKILPRLRVELVFTVAEPFATAATKALPAQQGIAVLPLGYRVYDHCTGDVVASSPPSKRGKEIADADRDPSCPPPGAPTEEEVQHQEEQAALPDTLNRGDIERTMVPVAQQIKECAEILELSGTAKVTFTVNPDGTMAGLKIAPPFDKGEAGACMRQALKRAVFPKFKAGRSIPVEYPFVLRR